MAHFHCVVCSVTIARKTDMVSHLKRHFNKGETEASYPGGSDAQSEEPSERRRHSEANGGWRSAHHPVSHPQRLRVRPTRSWRSWGPTSSCCRTTAPRWRATRTSTGRWSPTGGDEASRLFLSENRRRKLTLRVCVAGSWCSVRSRFWPRRGTRWSVWMLLEPQVRWDETELRLEDSDGLTHLTNTHTPPNVQMPHNSKIFTTWTETVVYLTPYWRNDFMVRIDLLS